MARRRPNVTCKVEVSYSEGSTGTLSNHLKHVRKSVKTEVNDGKPKICAKAEHKHYMHLAVLTHPQSTMVMFEMTPQILQQSESSFVNTQI